MKYAVTGAPGRHQAPPSHWRGVGAALLFLVAIGCGAGETGDTETSSAAARCFVLPGSLSGGTKSYRVEGGGRLEEVAHVDDGAMHMRAAFDPDGRTLYVNSVGIVGWGRWFRDGTRVERGTWEEGIHVRAYAYDPAECSIGPLLGAGRMSDEAPELNRVYGLEVHPNGRYLYQTTNSLRRIRLFDLPEDRVPLPREAFDATAGGEHVCAQVRRLAMHPSARHLYANCNNGDGVEDALQLWAIEADGSIALLEHYTFPAMNAGVLDPLIHPSGDWLYQPVGTNSPDAQAGIGAYVLVYRMGDNGRLTLHDQIAVRTIPAVSESTFVSILPMNMLLHPDGSTAYIPVHFQLIETDGSGNPTSAARPEDFAHGFAIYAVEDGGARLVEKAWMPALRETVYSSHHGGPFAGLDRELFLYSYLTDYDTIQGGILQRLRITDEHLLEPLDPPWVSTGLSDGRQPIPVPRSAPR